MIKVQFKLLKNKFKAKKEAGFTLVELMVSLTIFTVVVLAAVGSLYTVNGASRKVQSMRSVLDNLTFALEAISRTVRTSSAVVCGGSLNISGDPNCPFSAQAVNTMLLVDSTIGVHQLIEYRLGYPSGQTGGAIQKRYQENGIWTNWVSLTAPEIDIDHLYFYVDGASSTDSSQASVIVFAQGTATAGGTTSPFAIQTYISQRASE